MSDASAVLKAKGRTFWLASRLLPARTIDDVTTLYAFCRAVDDAVDDAPDATAAARAATALDRELRGAAPRLEIAAFLALASRRGLPIARAQELVAGVSSDVGRVRVDDDTALLRYAYLVAGTVGAMMRPLIRAEDERAAQPAIDLGIAMQLTNICRDVVEDALRDRVYLPARRLIAAGIHPDDVVTGRAPGPALAEVVAGVLALAETHYRQARAGYRFIPLRARLAIAVAGRLYREIGVRLLRLHGGDPRNGRVVVPGTRKIVLATLTVASVLADALRSALAAPLTRDRRVLPSVGRE